MLKGLDSLSEFNKSDKPTQIEFIYYLFFKRGISFTEFNELPIPYIHSILKTHTYVKDMEEKAQNKGNKK